MIINYFFNFLITVKITINCAPNNEQDTEHRIVRTELANCCLRLFMFLVFDDKHSINQGIAADEAAAAAAAAEQVKGSTRW